MAADIFERKVYFVGAWKGDVVTDAVIQTLHTKTETEKGKKVKLRLSRLGLQVRKPALFQGSYLLDAYRIEDVFFVTVSPRNKAYVLCIVKDMKYKYAILTFRCMSELDTGMFVKNFQELKGKNPNNNFIMKRKGDGNWSLRNDSAAGVRPKLSMGNGSPNGHVVNKAVQQHTVNEMTEITHVNKSTKTGDEKQNVAVQVNSSNDEISEAVSFQNEIEHLSHELKDIKLILEKSTGISATEHHHHQQQQQQQQQPMRHVRDDSINNNVTKHTNLNIDRDGTTRVYVSNRPPPKLIQHPVQIQISKNGDVSRHVFRARYGSASIPGVQKRVSTPMKATDIGIKVLKREFSAEEKAPRVMAVPGPKDDTNGDVADGTANHNGVLENGLVSGTVSGKSSLRVKFDNKSMTLSNPPRSRSMRMKTDFMVPSTIERSIENTYPIVGFNSHRRHVRRVRPQSVYIVSGLQRHQHPRITYEAQF